MLSGDNQWPCWVIGAILGVVGVLIARSQQPSYFVKVSTAGAEQRAYVSADKAEIEKIVAALNEAIIRRG